MVAVAVLGQGAVGCAAAERLGSAGFEVRSADRADRNRLLAAESEVLLLALTRGEECVSQLEEAPRLPPAVLDLTTQAPESTLSCTRRASALGARYHGGGLTGGGRELRAGRGVLLLGPPVEPGSPAAAVVGALGRAIPFPGPDAAALAKLLHNWVLVVQQWAAALALTEVRAHGERGLAEAYRLIEVLAAGTAGRPVPEWSVVRDSAGEPSSTYLARLAAKDLAELARAAPALAASAEPVLAALEQAFARLPDRPYTEALLRAADLSRGTAQEVS